jgi:hypothetical protein
MKRIITMTLLATAMFTTVLLSCNETDLLPEAPEPSSLTFSIIDGDTVKNRIEKIYEKSKDKLPNSKSYIFQGDTIVLYKEPKKNKKTSEAKGLIKLKDAIDKDKKLKMAAFGGGAASGFRDGGYFNEGIETSYPVLVARQMNIDFKQPKFNSSDYNGVGRMVKSNENYTGGPVIKYKLANNNTAILQSDDKSIKLKGSVNSEVDNFSYFNMTAEALFQSTLTSDASYGAENAVNQTNFYLEAQLYRRIFDKKQKSTILTKLKTKKYDLLLMNFGEITKGHLPQSYNIPFGKFNYIDQKEFIFTDEKLNTDSYYLSKIDGDVRIIRTLYDNNLIHKGVLFNIPNYWGLPYFNSIGIDDIERVLGSQSVSLETVGFYQNNQEKVQFIPVAQIDSLLSPKVNIALKAGVYPNPSISRESYILSRKSQYDRFIKYDEKIDMLAQKYNLAKVDLLSLYQKVLKGGYVTENGILVDPSWPDGNFFSLDGIYPTAFGQAIIANETIRAINNTYGTEIPLIDTRNFLEN